MAERKVQIKVGPRRKRAAAGKKGGKTGGARSQCFSLNAGVMPFIGRNIRDRTMIKVTKQYRLANVVTTSTTVPVFYAAWIALDGVSDYASIAAAFDEYKISQAEVWIVPQYGPGIDHSIGMSASCIDYNDAVAPSALSTIVNYSNAIQGPALYGHYHRWVPAVDIAAFKAGPLFGYSAEKNRWILTADSSVQHYGFKYGVDVSSGTYGVDVVVRLTVCFRLMN
jgi:hypothetical protein